MPTQHRFYLPPRPRFLDTLLFDKKLSRGRLVGSVFTPLGKVLSYEAGITKNPSLYGRGVEPIASAANPVITPPDGTSIYGIPGIGAGWAFCIRSLVQ